jgi:hypothetical protein
VGAKGSDVVSDLPSDDGDEAEGEEANGFEDDDASNNNETLN